MLTIGISGKRDISHEDESFIKTQIIEYIDELLKKSNQSSFTALTSIATGADSIFAGIVLDHFKQLLHVVLPFKQIEYQKDFLRNELRQFNEIITRADKIITVSENIPAGVEGRNESYFQAGIYIVEHSDAMLFVSDGEKPRGKGGTSDIIGYANQKRPISPNRIITVTPKKEDELHKRINQVFREADREAEINRDKHRQTWKNSLFMGWLAVSLFAIKTGFKIDDELGWLLGFTEFLLVSATIAFVLRANKNNFHSRYLSQRIRAEQLRLLEIYYLSDVPVSVPFLTEVSDTDLKEVKNKVNGSLAGGHYKSKWFANYKIKEMINGQISYHNKKISSIEKKRPHFYHQANLCVGILFCVNMAFHLICESMEIFKHVHIAPFWPHLSICLTIALPALYAAIEGILHFEDWEMIKKHSEIAEKGLTETLKIMTQQVQELDDNTCYDNQVDVLNNSAAIMLDDNRKWEIVLEEKANYHWI